MSLLSKREPLVDESRLSRAWEIIVSRVPGLDVAVPDAYIQRAGKELVDGKVHSQRDVAVFAIAEPNPRHVGTLQVSVVHMDLAGWMEKEAEIAHFVAKGFDPLTWVLFQVAKGHMETMSNIRAMSHQVTHVDPLGQVQPGSAPQNRLTQ